MINFYLRKRSQDYVVLITWWNIGYYNVTKLFNSPVQNILSLAFETMTCTKDVHKVSFPFVPKLVNYFLRESTACMW